MGMGMEEALVDYMIRHGVPLDVAQTCASKIVTNAKIGAAVGLAAGVLTSNPAALIMSAAAGVGFGATTLVGSTSCRGVREAAYRIASHP